MRTIAIYNLKGGVGKTAAAVNFSYLAARSGLRTLLWDLDPQGAATWYLLSDSEKSASAEKLIKRKVTIGEQLVRSRFDRLDLIPSNFSHRKVDITLSKLQVSSHTLKRLINPFGETHSLVVLDCPPSLSKLAEQIFDSADAIFVPLVPTYLSLRTFEQAMEYIKAHKLGHKQVYPFFSMVDIRRQLHRGLLNEPPKNLKRLLTNYIPYSAVIEKMGEHRAPLPVYARTHPATGAYERLLQEVLAAR